MAEPIVSLAVLKLLSNLSSLFHVEDRLQCLCIPIRSSRFIDELHIVLRIFLQPLFKARRQIVLFQGLQVRVQIISVHDGSDVLCISFLPLALDLLVFLPSLVVLP